MLKIIGKGKGDVYELPTTDVTIYYDRFMHDINSYFYWSIFSEC